MKYIKLFESFNKSDLEKELDKYGIENYTINSDGTIDVNGSVFLSDAGFTKIPFKFGRVSGDFYCILNSLKTLEGSPYYVGGNFECQGNKLKDLKGSPEEVGRRFVCDSNELESLDGMPLEIGGDFLCKYNKNLKELKSISNIEGMIMCDNDIDISKFRGYCEKIRLVGFKDGEYKWEDIYLK